MTLRALAQHSGDQLYGRRASMDPRSAALVLPAIPCPAGTLRVICEVSTEALRLLAELHDASGEELIGDFEIHKDTILAIASRTFDKGDPSPKINDNDIQNLKVVEDRSRNRTANDQLGILLLPLGKPDDAGARLCLLLQVTDGIRS